MRWNSAPTIAAAAAFLLNPVSAQTSSTCNPLNSESCAADPALGTSINVDFTQGSVNSFAASGNPTYDKTNGAQFTVAKGGDAPQLVSLFYIMFGRLEITMKAAPGKGIVSSVVMQSDDLDEIDMEWLGSEAGQMQSNYFGKGKVTTYNRGEFHNVANTQSDFITYTIDWTKDRIEWMVGGTSVRTLTPSTAESDQYPQTPMQIKFGTWAGGDSNYNAAGTVKWAEGPTDYSAGPFTMSVQKLVVTDYSTGKQYKYKDTSGGWESIEAVGGSVNGNVDGSALTVTATAAGTTATGSGSDGAPPGGLARAREEDPDATATQTGWPWTGSAPTEGAVPSGWFMNSDGKIEPNSKLGAAPGPVHALLVPVLMAAGAALLVGRAMF